MRTPPFPPHDPVDRPVSLYAATKRADELMAETYTHLFGLKATGLRYFTVYGPWGRPDMSPYIFAKAIHEGRTIELFHLGFVKRDYSYIDDIVTGTIAVLDKPPQGGRPPALQSRRLAAARTSSHVVSLFEKALGREARIELKPGDPFDIPETAADISDTTRNSAGCQQFRQRASRSSSTGSRPITACRRIAGELLGAAHPCNSTDRRASP